MASICSEFNWLCCPLFKWHSKTRPFGIQPLINHSNTRVVWYLLNFRFRAKMTFFSSTFFIWIHRSIGSVANTLKFDVSANSPLQYFGGPVISRKQPAQSAQNPEGLARKQTAQGNKAQAQSGGRSRDGVLFQVPFGFLLPLDLFLKCPNSIACFLSVEKERKL